MARGGGRSTPSSNRRRHVRYPWFLELSEGSGSEGSGRGRWRGRTLIRLKRICNF